MVVVVAAPPVEGTEPPSAACAAMPSGCRYVAQDYSCQNKRDRSKDTEY